MKRILVIDESEVIRETLALILGREFVVIKRPFGRGGLSFGDSDSEVDLLILGLAPVTRTEASRLLEFATRLPFAVLFLVESQKVANLVERSGRVACLSKPFNPYELRQKVGGLLAPGSFLPKAQVPTPIGKKQGLARYLQHPYLSRSAASFARRFADSRLPLLIKGEIGCGQGRVARAVHSLGQSGASCVVHNAADLNAKVSSRTFEEPYWRNSIASPAVTVLIENLDKLDQAGQVALDRFLDENTSAQCRFLATAQTDLLAGVYSGEFLESLYYKLATLALTLLPLRERREDVPALANWFAQPYAQALGLASVSISPDAIDRLRNYQWFGNLNEMEAVIARTLVAHRKARIEASDLFFDLPGAHQSFDAFEPIDIPAAEKTAEQREEIFEVVHPVGRKLSPLPTPTNGKASAPDLRALIHELAHELKNPMVSIKTFAQLLSERYQDEAFRARFQDIVDGDIERIDDLLEVMIDFADFSQPRKARIQVRDEVRSVLTEVSEECTERQTSIRWKGEAHSCEIMADEAQFKYALKNVLLAVLFQSKAGSEIELNTESKGCLVVSYMREAAPIGSLTHYLDSTASKSDDDLLPLRILLARQLVERNGGDISIEHLDNERDVLRMEFPIG